MAYTQNQWILMFFIYCILGWIWESCYVSIRKRSFINRGFLHGPWLPIYGTGAILILFCTLPAQESLLLVYLLGMVSATLLEYFTGAAMEKLFHMRYWDYSGKPLNVNGHICLPVSLAWGGFSVLLTEALHPPVERFVVSVPAAIGEKLVLALTVLFVIDATKSVQNALDIKELLKKMAESSEAVREFELRMEEVAAQFSRNSEQFRARLRELEAEAARRREEAMEQREEKANTRKERLVQNLAHWRDRDSRLFTALEEKGVYLLDETEKRLMEAASQEERERLGHLRTTLMESQYAIRKARMDRAGRRYRDYERALAVLERNPSAASKRYQETLAELRELKGIKGVPGRKKNEIQEQK